MSLSGTFYKRDLQFKFDAGTSRGILKNKVSYILKIFNTDNPQIFGLGESGPLPGLSIDFQSDIENILHEVVNEIKCFNLPDNKHDISIVVNQLVEDAFPSVKFALETSLLDLLHGGKRLIFENRFSRGEEPIPVNGLIWMGEPAFMLEQIREKLKEGYRCIKMKIGALDFDQECEVLRFIRSKYSEEEIELRVDANGAFSKEEALKKLNILQKYKIHSIEQPIAAGQIKEMEALCRESPIPIALDEELIGIHDSRLKEELLRSIKPQFIILKPTLLGGFTETQHWINLAEKLSIGWWVTSALESNIGLNAISQFVGDFEIKLPQGLGTGKLFTNNFDSPLYVNNGFIHYDRNSSWDINL